MTIKGGTNKACAACKYQRRRCSEECLLAPYFPADKPKTFSNAHRLFGVSNITKILKKVEPCSRDEAMESIIFESDMRAKFPKDGCVGVISQYRFLLDQAVKELNYFQNLLLAFCKERYQERVQHILPLVPPLYPMDQSNLMLPTVTDEFLICSGGITDNVTGGKTEQQFDIPGSVYNFNSATNAMIDSVSVSVDASASANSNVISDMQFENFYGIVVNDRIAESNLLPNTTGSIWKREELFNPNDMDANCNLKLGCNAERKYSKLDWQDEVHELYNELDISEYDDIPCDESSDDRSSSFVEYKDRVQILESKLVECKDAPSLAGYNYAAWNRSAPNH